MKIYFQVYVVFIWTCNNEQTQICVLRSAKEKSILLLYNFANMHRIKVDNDDVVKKKYI